VYPFSSYTYFSNRKTFCAMALIADEAISNLTAVIESTLGSDGREILIVMAGDNGGMPGAVGAADRGQPRMLLLAAARCCSLLAACC
jgi:hypothetical protein